MDANIIKQKIREYNTTPSICKMLGVSFSHNKQNIEKVAEDNGLLKLLQENNRTSKLGSHNIYRIHVTVGELIKADVTTGALMKDIVKKYSIPIHALKKYLCEFKLYSTVVQNRRILGRDLLRANSLKVKSDNLYTRKHDINAIQEFGHSKSAHMTKASLIRECISMYNISKTSAQKYLKEIVCVRHDNTGKNNKMYGVAPTSSSGIGASGKLIYEGYNVHFRSSLELRVFIYLINNGTPFVLSNHRIKYKWNDVDRTYNPDIVVASTVYEIKPDKLIRQPINAMKFKALQDYCTNYKLQCQYITENTYDLSFFNEVLFANMVEDGYIILSEVNYKKIIKYIK